MIHYHTKSVILMILYWSYGFSQKIATSLWRHIPEAELLIVANSPLLDDSSQRRKSYVDSKGWGDIGDRCTPYWINKYCQKEYDWFVNQDQATVVKTPRWMHHGTAIDFAVKWMNKNQIRRFVHIESDCEITGRRWYDRLLSKESSLVTYFASIPRFLTPSVWNVYDVKNESFEYTPYCNQYDNPKVKRHGYWDTGGLLFTKMMEQNRVIELTTTNDFKHWFHGSTKVWEEAV